MATKRTRRTPRKSLWDLKFKKRDSVDFKPDVVQSTWTKTFRLTRLQQLRLAKWALYALTIVLSLVVQDVLMSRFRIFGGTTDLPICAILLITVIEGTEVGSIFVLIASVLYYFSGSAPGPYSIILTTVLGIAAVIFRQLFWHRSKGSIVLCAGIAVTLYQIGLFIIGLMSSLTSFGRLGAFLLNGLLSAAAMVLLYPLIYKIGLIGGNTWKE